MMTIKDDGVYLIDGTRTAIGAYGGSLALTRPDDMAASIIRALLQRHPEKRGGCR
jgi:acetyl-CoA acetyltransferase